MKSRRRFMMLAVAALFAAPLTYAQTTYPNKPVRIVVPFSPGTAADIAARALGARLGEIWGQGVVVENQSGAAGNIGAATVAKAAPDGYTLVMLGINHVINPSLYKDIPYDIPRDFKPIVRVSVAPLAFVAHPKFPPNTIPELIAYAKARPKEVNYGSGGSGSVTHLSFELLKSQAGIDMTHVPYKSIAPMMSDILGNQIPLGSPALASAVGNVKGGQLKILAVTSAKRSSQMPDVPTVAEAGLTGFDVSAWNGLLAPRGTPDAIVEKIHADVVKVAQSREFLDQLRPQALEVELLGPAAFGTFLSAELDKWSKLVKSSGAKVD
ncbi:MAG TPA: tripartite tricarboxylate transporter substrate binding protein [Casimicrobiaceae bacterium]|nr:tripartite tricarboxylate transporter substrate binding protein [Casimicrobiaceae bacterium]